MNKNELTKIRESMFYATRSKDLSEAGRVLYEFVDGLGFHKLWDDYEMDNEELEVHANAVADILKENVMLKEQLELAMASQGGVEKTKPRRL